MANQFVAFQDERHGLGAWVAEQIAADLFRYGVVTDPKGNVQRDENGQPIREMPPHTAQHQVASSYGASLSAPGGRLFDGGGAAAAQHQPQTAERLNFAYRTWTSPRATAEATVSAVISQKAQVGVVPLYDNDNSFNKDTLATLIDYPMQNVLREYVAESNYVLAAPTDLIHEIEQAGYTDSFAAGGSQTPFTWNADKQQRYLRKVTTIFASADAMAHCQAALDGFRAQGIDVQLIPDGVDSYREGLRVASELLDPERIVETHFSGNKHERVSLSRGQNHTKPLIGVLLSADKAMKPDGYNYDSDYAVLEAEMAGADRIRTSFIVTQKGIPPIPPADVDFVDFEMRAIASHFRPQRGQGGGIDHRALYPVANDAAPRETRRQEPPAYIRVLYKFDTVGAGARDYSVVLRRLSEQGLSYQTTTLDNRPNHPMVVSIDVPANKYRTMERVLRSMRDMPNARRLADFPALQPMIKEEIRPRPTVNHRMQKALWIILGVLIFLAGWAFSQF